MLTLFLLLGVAYAVSATRAREAARAYARLTFGGDDVRIPAAGLLDSVLLRVLRGPVPAPATPPYESLLKDKYGPDTITGRMTTLSRVANSPLLVATLSLPSALKPTDLVGRVLTLQQAGRRVTSHRIVSASGTGTIVTNTSGTAMTVQLDLPAGPRGFWLPAIASSTTAVIRAVVNGREFDGATAFNENWDGFDSANEFLAQVEPGPTVSTSVVSRLSFARGIPSSSADADNDGDGVNDGVFQDFGFPSFTDSFGNTVRVDASVLVLDLDGRFNVNAHGSLSPIVYGTSHGNWSSLPALAADLPNAPLGSGYGPPDIQANLGFGAEPRSPAAGLGAGGRLFDSGTLQPGENPRWNLTVGARAGSSTLSGARPPNSRYSVNQSTPRPGPMEAKYGEKAVVNNVAPPNVEIGDPDCRYARPGVAGTDDAASRLVDRRAPPTFSTGSSFGVPPVWWDGDSAFNWGILGTSFPLPRGVYNSPPDLHGRMKTLTLSATTTPGAIAPQLVFALPEWSTSTTVGGQRESRDDPYELLLDTRVGRGGIQFDPSGAGTSTSTASGNRDNPFTPAELEPVLRPYDIDTNRLPPRLAAMLGSAAEQSRLGITTDSWDTTAITGRAALRLSGTQGGTTGWLQQPALETLVLTDTTSPLLGVLGGEVARGERFDLNRALAASGTTNAGYNINTGNINATVYYRQRQAYFKDLFTLLVALNQGDGPHVRAANDRIAQWTANIIEFRDADSIMTPFECDIDPSNGWSVDGNVQTDEGVSERVVVFGVERPEILIAETLAWERVDPSTTGTTGGLLISLHRPWNAVATGAVNAQIAAEPCDYAFDTLANGANGRPLNVVDLGKKPHSAIMSASNSQYNNVASGSFPIWRLRIVSDGGTQFVRFDTGSASALSSNPLNELIVGGPGAPGTRITSGNDKPKLPVDTTFTFFSGTSVRVGGGTVSLSLSGSTQGALSSGTFRVAGGPSGPGFTDTVRTGTMFLERLANPSIPATAAIWSAPPLASGTTNGTSAQQYVVVDALPLSVINTGTQVPPPTLQSTRRIVTGETAPWKNDRATSDITGNFPTFAATANGASSWLPWPNRPFVSSAELTLVPRDHSLGMLQNYAPRSPANTIFEPAAMDLFEAVHVPTRFAGIHQTTTGTLTAARIFSTGSNAITTINQLSSFREPGRVNLNTVTSDEVWNAVVGGPRTGVAVSRVAARFATDPAAGMNAVLSLTGGAGGPIVSDAAAPGLRPDLNPLHGIYTATRLANTVTPRSNVFAIWITIRERVANDPDSVKYHRAFYIVDRSIPVAFVEGEDYNVWDCVRLRRIIE
jgi:hypothetical protein